MGFALFFLGEYKYDFHECFMCYFISWWMVTLTCNVFYFTWIHWGFWLGLKTIFFLFLYIWTRAAFPRYRYDQLMKLGWKVFLPLSLAWVILVAGTLVTFDLLP